MMTARARNKVVILILLALCLAAFGQGFEMAGSKLKTWLDRELLGALFRDKVDLTHAEKSSGQFAYRLEHGIAFFFDTGHVYKSRDDVKEALCHVSGKLLVKDANEHVVVDVNISDFRDECAFILPPTTIGNFDDLLFMPAHEDRQLVGGQYTYELSIATGDSNLPAGKQFFLAQKRICGLEYLTVLLLLGFKWISWGIAAILLVIAFIKGCAERRRWIVAQRVAATKE
jgi:hypothetical protein